MNIAIIAGLILLVLFLCGYIAYLKGYRITKKQPMKLTEDQKQKAERLRKEFEEVMGYNLQKALERKRA